ncbi:gluconate 2-dehydrogenase subunit 3 family protein [Prosthecobacter sp.]|uniref:gluconate 2-dehydrogenase subunit 3 family protein n=1 Tax=Prosthecobacter sp. TaxID=1965333 RepID=UPI002487E47A|nr:gluconate 2-dehydrogenase subunit 3 family protein [Prosthecobacter sp.]MDI1314913.1 gluconate 2-dehydrogenase subunit 3 family protein [Prosthecobacter sp.]
MNSDPSPISRRHALKGLFGSAAGAAAVPVLAAPRETEPAPPAHPTRFVFHDPDFMQPLKFPWEKLLSAEELATTQALADLILPKDETSPAASEVGVPDFINEWVSADYPAHQEDRETIRGGLGWLNTESFKRFSGRFEELGVDQQSAIADDICGAAQVKPEHHVGAVFFKRFRQLCVGGYYSHSKTWKSLGYVGNISLGGPYPGVLPEVIEKLGLQDVV